MEIVHVSSERYGTTLVKVDKIVTKYTWTIKNFPLCAKVYNDYLDISSPDIPVAYDHNAYFENYRLRVSIYYFNEVNILVPSYSIIVSNSLLRANLYITRKGRNIFSIMNGVLTKSGLDIRNIFKSKSYTEYLDENDLIIKCVFTFETKSIINIEGAIPNLEAAKSQSFKSTLNEFEKLLDSAKFSDITLIVGEKQFPVHKAILASRSPVFSAMFDHNMLENKKDVVEISDIEPEIMAEVLRFIYSSKVKGIKVSTSDLLYAAVKYQLDGLRLMCEEVFIEELQQVSKLDEILKIVDKYETCRRLRDAVLAYLSSNRQKLSDDFSRFEKTLSPSFFDEATKAMST